jgi:hypothetical protein
MTFAKTLLCAAILASVVTSGRCEQEALAELEARLREQIINSVFWPLEEGKKFLPAIAEYLARRKTSYDTPATQQAWARFAGWLRTHDDDRSKRVALHLSLFVMNQLMGLQPVNPLIDAGVAASLVPTQAEVSLLHGVYRTMKAYDGVDHSRCAVARAWLKETSEVLKRINPEKDLRVLSKADIVVARRRLNFVKIARFVPLGPLMLHWRTLGKMYFELADVAIASIINHVMK